MKALLIAEVGPAGGALTFLFRLLEVHRRRGLRTEVLLGREHAHPAVVARLEREGLTVRVGPRRPALFGKAGLSLLFDQGFVAGACRAARPDLIVVSSTNLGPLLGLLAHRPPAVVFLHTAPEVRLSLVMRLWLRACLGPRKRLATVSRFAARRVEDLWGLPEGGVAVVHNAAPQAAPPGPPPPPRVLTLAAAVAYKNPGTWLRTAGLVRERRPDAMFSWIGDGELLAGMREEVGRRGWGSWIELPGASEDPFRWLREARVYFQPSVRESHGIAVLEAMAHGLPCVVSDGGGLPESVLEGETGFLADAGDAGGFADRIVRLLEDPALAARLGRAGCERAGTVFSAAAQEEKFAALYAAVLGVPLPAAGLSAGGAGP